MDNPEGVLFITPLLWTVRDLYQHDPWKLVEADGSPAEKLTGERVPELPHVEVTNRRACCRASRSRWTRLLSDRLVIMNKAKSGGGRDHWSNVYSVMLAGAGIKPGAVLGESDAHGAFVKPRPVSPADILATMYHLKGIDHEMTIPDRLKRPTKLVEDGEVLSELLA